MSEKLFIGSHAPFWHTGDSILKKNLNIMLAASPAFIYGILLYGTPALGVITLSVGSAIMWELLMNLIMKRPISVGDGSAATIGLLFGMLLPATAPWWLVLVGTFIAIVVAKQIYGGIGCNPFNPVLVAMAMLLLSWKNILDFNAALVDYDLPFKMVYPLSAVKYFGGSSASDYSLKDLLLGKQAGERIETGHGKTSSHKCGRGHCRAFVRPGDPSGDRKCLFYHIPDGRTGRACP